MAPSRAGVTQLAECLLPKQTVLRGDNLLLLTRKSRLTRGLVARRVGCEDHDGAHVFGVAVTPKGPELGPVFRGQVGGRHSQVDTRRYRRIIGAFCAPPLVLVGPSTSALLG